MRRVVSADWATVLASEFEKEYYLSLEQQLKNEYASSLIFPPEEYIFSALELTPFNDVRVVILGQDPYHDDFQAHGLCFSVKKGVKLPPSLRNIFKELNAEYGYPLPTHGNLEKWAKQGVLLLNSVLTVRAHEAASHSNLGWQLFTDRVIAELNRREKPIIFVLWGNYARTKKMLITSTQHIVLEAAHPSPLSAHRGFFGSKPFSSINKILRDWNEKEIDWEIE